MGYQQAMEAAGATVLAYERFGSYQGDWLAKVVYNSETFYVAGAYGSCSGCDAFDREFDFDGGPECDEHRYSSETDCQDCVAKKSDYDKRLATFGLSYLTDPFTKEQLVKQFTAQSEWDQDSEDVLKWLESN